MSCPQCLSWSWGCTSDQPAAAAYLERWGAAVDGVASVKPGAPRCPALRQQRRSGPRVKDTGDWMQRSDKRRKG